MKTPRHSALRAAFSLIELVVVIAIIAIVATFTVPAATSILRGSAMTQAQQMLTDQISLARQFALSKNRSVEVRFYQLADPEQPGEDATKPDTGQFRALQIFEIVESGVGVPIDKVQRLPSSVIMNQTGQLSSIIGGTGQTIQTPGNQDPDLPRGVAKKYKYVSLRFQPDGSTTLAPTGKWFVTIHNLSDGATMTSVEGKNFFTIQIDPVSGSTKGFRPTAG